MYREFIFRIITRVNSLPQEWRSEDRTTSCLSILSGHFEFREYGFLPNHFSETQKLANYLSNHYGGQFTPQEGQGWGLSAASRFWVILSSFANSFSPKISFPKFKNLQITWVISMATNLPHSRCEGGATVCLSILSDSFEFHEHFLSKNIFQNSKTRKLRE